jgi:hypothetical protein
VFYHRQTVTEAFLNPQEIRLSERQAVLVEGMLVSGVVLMGIGYGGNVLKKRAQKKLNKQKYQTVGSGLAS